MLRIEHPITIASVPHLNKSSTWFKRKHFIRGFSQIWWL